MSTVTVQTRWALLALVGAALFLVGTSTPALGADPVTVVVAADIHIGTKAGTLNTATSNRALADQPDLTLLAGDIASEGLMSQYTGGYADSWGRLPNVLAAPGNHDYHVAGASAFKDYFGYEATYHATDAGRWRVYTLDSNVLSKVGTAQHTWLKADLAANPGRPIMAVMHHCRYCSWYPDNAKVKPLYDLLIAARADLVVNGHEHIYQRMDAVNGIVQITSATTGRKPRSTVTADPHVAKMVYATGYLRIRLSDSAYTAQFVDQLGALRDTVTNPVHNQ